MAKYKGIKKGSAASRQVMSRVKANKRTSKAKADFLKQQDRARNLSSVVDFAGSVTDLGVAVAPNLKEWQQYEEGREAVGLDRTDEHEGILSKVGQTLKRAFTTPDLKEKHTVWSQAKGWDESGYDKFGEERGHAYTSAELKNIGKNVLAGTDKQALKAAGASSWQDIYGEGAGKRLANPASYMPHPGSIDNYKEEMTTSHYTDMNPGPRMYVDESGANVTDWSPTTQSYTYGKYLDEIALDDVDISRDEAYLDSLLDIDEIQRKADIEIGEQNQASRLKEIRAKINERDKANYWEQEDIEDFNTDENYENWETSSIADRSEMLGNAMIGGRRGVTQSEIEQAMNDARMRIDEGTTWNTPPRAVRDYNDDMSLIDKLGTYMLGQETYQGTQNKTYDIEGYERGTGFTFRGDEVMERTPRTFKGDVKSAWGNLGRFVTGANTVLDPWNRNK